MASICKSCGKGFQGTKKQRTCSAKCHGQWMAKARACQPACDETTLSTRAVTFKDGTQHHQQVCERCRKTTWLPKRWGVQTGVIARPKPVKQYDEFINLLDLA